MTKERLKQIWNESIEAILNPNDEELKLAKFVLIMYALIAICVGYYYGWFN